MKRFISIIFFSMIFVTVAEASNPVLVDRHATKMTTNLYLNLKGLIQNGLTMFGQQDATLYGRTWMGGRNHSDVKDVCGENPALIGLDYGSLIYDRNKPDELAKEKTTLIDAVEDTYKRGGVVAFCCHMPNPANDGSFYWAQDSINVVADLLPKGKFNKRYTEYLDIIADITSDFKDEQGNLIPVIYRPFHEFDGDWFWWGAKHCSKANFIALWRFTVSYLRDVKHVHNMLYAISPDCKFTTEAEYLDRYPGDKYVDILGVDDYWDFRPDGANNPSLALKKLKIVSTLSVKKNKLAAFTETGLESLTQADWFTATLLPILKQVHMAYVMVWRNAYNNNPPNHYFAPTVGHKAAKDFIKFRDDKSILFETELPKMYQLNK